MLRNSHTTATAQMRCPLPSLALQGVSHAETHSDDGYRPFSSVQHRPVADVNVSSYGRVLVKPFQVCSECMCCQRGDRSNCRQLKCCHRIICNQPGKPFGYCSLKPISCDCINCQ
ncbi:hypothetical protein GW17_00060154 [Ensete ventricosum]|nr:hypothetical protein GW17_00060154 [Ensete ventricosum]